MALIRNTEAQATPNPFEEAPEVTTVTPTPAAPTAPAVASTPAPVAVVKTASNAMALPQGSMAERMAASDVYASLHNLMFTTWDAMPTIKASQGRFSCDKKTIGSELKVEILSWQDQWLISPGGQNTPENTKLVRYSDDGVTTTKGDNCSEYLQSLLNAGHTKASMAKRLVLVMVMDACDKAPELAGMPVQINLAPTSASKFNALRNQVTFKVSRGLLTPEAATKIKLVADPVNSNNNDYTVVNFSLQ